MPFEGDIVDTADVPLNFMAKPYADYTIHVNSGTASPVHIAHTSRCARTCLARRSCGIDAATPWDGNALSDQRRYSVPRNATHRDSSDPECVPLTVSLSWWCTTRAGATCRRGTKRPALLCTRSHTHAPSTPHARRWAPPRAPSATAEIRWNPVTGSP